MRLPKDLLSPGMYVKPNIFLCETDKQRICKLETMNTQASFKFNSYSEISFEVSRIYNDVLTGQTKINPFFDHIEALRLIELENIGYFEIQTATFNSDGIRESKSVTAYSLEYTLSQKYLTDFYVNTGEVNSKEVIYAEEKYGVARADNTAPVVLYDKDKDKRGLSLLHLALSETYGWTIKSVDESLTSLTREFEVDRTSVYDFLINEVATKFNCYFVFDTINNEIKVYAESLTQKKMGDGERRVFTLDSIVDSIGSVTVGGYKTTKYLYNNITGELTFEEPPADNQIIEITDGSLSDWATDICVSFDNLSQQVTVDYSADDIKTFLTVTGADELDIREVNLGLPYIMDLSYYRTPEWFGEDLYNAYNAYQKYCNTALDDYKKNSQKINEYDALIDKEMNRMSSIDDGSLVMVEQEVDSETSGVYFIRVGTQGSHYYEEVTLPKDFDVNEIYYRMQDESMTLTPEKARNLLTALKQYFCSYFSDIPFDFVEFDDLDDSFAKFLGTEYTELKNYLKDVKKLPAQEVVAQDMNSTNSSVFVFAPVNIFFNKMWEELGVNPLDNYLNEYTTDQTQMMEAGYGEVTHEYYGYYFGGYLAKQSVENAIALEKAFLATIESEQAEFIASNSSIAQTVDLYTFFEINYKDNYDNLMKRLSAFIREDEYIDENFVETEMDTLDDIYKLKQELLECGKIELNKLCQPKLQFSMTMANIYALPEFEPIIGQFQLGRVIKVAIRPDYIKQARLLQIDMGLDDFSDFSCSFGELTNLKSQSDIHADLLSQAISAGKSVASNKSYWNKGADQANEIDLRIQNGLLDAVTSIKSMDATQNVEIDKYGIHMRKLDPDTGEYDPEQGWITNNKFLYSSDAFKTVKSVFGKYNIDGEEFYGLLAEAVIAGYIEGSKIKGSEFEGGTIQIGDLGEGKWAFEVKENGDVYMLGGDVKFTQGAGGEAGSNSISDSLNIVVKDLETQQEQINEIKTKQQYSIEIYADGPTTITTLDDVTRLTCKVFSWDADITDTLDDSQFNWIRSSNNAEKDLIWNSLPKCQGKKFVDIGVDDIYENASFSCEVNFED